MRILQMSMDYPPRHGGGTTVHTHKLAHAFKELGHDVTVVAATAPGAPGLEDDEGVSIHRVRRPYTYFSGREGRRISESMDVVHGHGICTYGLMRYEHPPVAIKMHNVWAQELEAYRKLPGSASWRYVNISIPQYIRREKDITNRADRLICISDYIADGAMGYGVPRDRMAIIRNGVDTGPFDSAEPKELDLDPPVVAYIGRLSPHKGVDRLIKAFKAQDGGSLLIVGRGESEAELRRIAEPLGKRVLFTGVVPHEEVPSYYLASDVIVYPTLYEPLGNVILEGMASRRPVIGSRTGGIPEILPEDSGFLFDSQKELSEKLSLLMDDEGLRRRLGTAGRSHAESRSWMDVASDTVAVLNEIIDGGSE